MRLFWRFSRSDRETRHSTPGSTAGTHDGICTGSRIPLGCADNLNFAVLTPRHLIAAWRPRIVSWARTGHAQWFLHQVFDLSEKGRRGRGKQKVVVGLAEIGFLA